MSKEKILIVEDDINISKLVKYNLEKIGYTCILCTTGEGANTVRNVSCLNGQVFVFVNS